ncbi:hypothetical protein VTO42DRAFT_6783 [Malbranchea cinnamomea]
MMGRRDKRTGGITTATILYNCRTSTEEISNRTAASEAAEGLYLSQESLESKNSDREYYPIKCILDESRRKYLIAWKGPYSPTWEPKHFANRAAVRVWKRKKEKRRAAADLYRNLRPSRHKNQTQQSAAPSSGPPSLPSTIPDSQSSRRSKSTLICSSQCTQNSACDKFSQGTSSSGSLFYPDSSGVTSQASETVSSQSQELLTQSTTSGTTFDSSEWFLESDVYASASKSASANLTAASRTSSSLAQLSPVIQTSQETNSQSSGLPNDRLSRASCSTANTLCLQSTKGPTLEASRRLYHSTATAVEVGETPPSKLVPETNNCLTEPSTLSSSLSGVQDTPSSVYQALKTAFRETQHSNLSAVLSIPETVLSCRSRSSSKRRFLRQYSNPESSPSTRRPLLRRRSSWAQGTLTEGIPESETWDSLPSLSRRAHYSFRSADTVSELGAMDSPGPNKNGASSHPSSALEAARNIQGSLRDRLNYIRSQERAAVQPLQNLSGSATPSSAGDIEPTIAPSQSETVSPLSVRVDKESHAHQQTRPEPAQGSPVAFVAPQELHYNAEHAVVAPDFSKEGEPDPTGPSGLELPVASQEEQEDTAGQATEVIETAVFPEHGGVGLGPLEFAVPLPMDSRVKDDYDRTLNNEINVINRYLEMSEQETSTEAESNSTVSKVRKMIEQLDNVCTHPDLNLVETPPVNVNDISREASWAEYSSSKFLFLGYFIDAALDLDLHVIIMVKGGRTAKIMENYFLGKGFSLRLTPSSEACNGSEIIFYRESLSFGVRTTTDERIIEPFRPPALIIALDSSFNPGNESVKHLRATSIPGLLTPVIRLVIANTSEHIRLCLPQCPDSMKLRLLVKNATSLCSCAGELQDDALGVQEDAEEILAYLASDPRTRKWPLPLIEALEIQVPEAGPPSSEQENLRSMASSGQKRWLEGEVHETISPSKRQRMSPSQDITHVSDSAKGQTQDNSTGPQHLMEKTVGSTKKEPDTEIEKLRSALAEMENRLKATEASLSALQHRYETKHSQLHKVRKDLEAALEGAKRSASRIERQTEEILKLKEEKAALAKQLEDARNIIKSGGGDAAELVKSREEAQRLRAENEKLQRTVHQERSQSEYTRQQYQNASSAAAKSGMEVRKLEEEIKELKKKSSEEAVHLKTLRQRSDEKTHLARIRELETTLALRESILAKKEEEIFELRKNRPNTRSTSLQPRSPKWNNNNSRPASPAPNTSATPRGSSALRFRAEA